MSAHLARFFLHTMHECAHAAGLCPVITADVAAFMRAAVVQEALQQARLRILCLLSRSTRRAALQK